MKSTTADYPLVIIGAGAAGLGASKQAKLQDISHIVVEASHRIGGRGLTEYLEDKIPVDLGCHWMHSASLNPFVEIADQLGFEYTGDDNYSNSIFSNHEWLPVGKEKEFLDFEKQCFSKMEKIYRDSPGSPAIDGIDASSEWAPYFYYWMSLMHSNDIDQVAVQDVIEYNETNEDWPVKAGYGALIARHGQDCPVKLNTAVTSIDWSSRPAVVETNQGTIRADKVIITVSTGVLASGQISFKPVLPQSKHDAIDALPLGNCNYQIFSVDKNAFDADTPGNIQYSNSEVSMAITIRPFDTPCVFTATAGRFAWWLEKQGPEASKTYFEDALVDIFGSRIRNKLREFKVSAWGYDPWIRGAYSSQVPGKTGMRQVLASSLDECLYFAGEATSGDFLNTAHGAYLSGKRAIGEL
jgi:monoamine oxidase